MQLFYEIFPIFLFFIAFKFYGIYAATITGMLATFIQTVIYRVCYHRWDNKQLVTLGVFLLFGGMTLYFHNPIFVKWKPTIVFWVFALFLIGSQLFTGQPLMQRLLQQTLQDNKHSVPAQVWKKLNVAWALFFAGLGSLNLYIAYYFSNDAWVNFKFYGVTGLLLLFSVLQAMYLMYYFGQKKEY